MNSRNIGWWNEYDQLSLYGGNITFITDDGEDMIEIEYCDGMLIDVGKSSCDNFYYVTVVSSNDETGWKTPLMEIAVADKKYLIDQIQKAILQFRLR